MSKEITGETFEQAMMYLSKQEPVEFKIDALTAFCMVSAMQLALRHPQFKGLAHGLVEKVTVNLAAILSKEADEVRAIVESGFVTKPDDVVRTE